MSSKLLRLMTLLLALLMCVFCFAACNGNRDNGNGTGTGTGTGSGTGTSDGDEEDPNSPAVIYRPEAVNYDNYEYRIIAPNQNQFGNGHFCAAEGENDIINESLRRRQTLMQDKYGVVMKLETSGEISRTILRKHTAKTYFADLTFYPVTEQMKHAQSGIFYDLNSLEELNLEAPYWDQRIQQDYRIGDMLFHVVGDIDTLDELVTFGFIYGKVAYNSMDYDTTYGSIYDIVRNQDWTFRLMLEMAAPYTGNVDADPNMGIEDKWGLLTECQATYYLFIGSGIRPMSSVDGELKLNLLDDAILYNKTSSILQEIVQMASNEKVAYAERDFAGGYGDAATIFKANRALFRTSSLSTTMGLGTMEDDFGILPIPMWEAKQGAYYNMVAAPSNWPLAIPKSVGADRVSMVANIAEIISYHSRFGDDEPLYESFFERLTSLKVCRSDEDKEMLMLIFDSKVFDLDQATTTMNIYNEVTTMARNRTDSSAVTTMLSSVVSAGDSAMRDMISVYEKYNKPAEE